MGHGGERGATAATLHALHLAHATHIPFENLDILLGRPVHLDLGALQAKLVRGGRGGYCFEQNLLFAAALERLGFAVRCLAARVRHGTDRVLPRTHMLLEVAADGTPWLADVGFGGDGLLLPVPLRPGEISRQFAWAYRLLEDAGSWLLQSRQGDAWQDLYAFTREPHFLIDYEMANHYVSTYPASRFVQTLTVQRPAPDVRYLVRDRDFVVQRPDGATRRTLDEDELVHVLGETFGLHFPAGTRFVSQRERLERNLGRSPYAG